jgi:hypothetical protein
MHQGKKGVWKLWDGDYDELTSSSTLHEQAICTS